MNGKTYGTTELHLPSLKSNIPNDRVFTNVLHFILFFYRTQILFLIQKQSMKNL